MKRLISIAVFACITATAFSQLLHIEAPADTAITNPAFLYSHYGMQRNIFDANGVANYDNPDIKTRTSMILYLGGYRTSHVFVEPGQTLTVKFTKDKADGTLKPTYKGKNAVLTELTNQLTEYSPSRNVGRHVMSGQKDSATYETELARQTSEMKRLNKIARQIKDKTDQARQLKLVKEKYLANCISLYLKRAQEDGIAPINDSELQGFLAQIDPNDSTLDERLLSLYLNAKYPIVVNSESALNTWMDTRIDIILQYITEPSIRADRLQAIAYRLANGSASDLDIDRLWARLQEVGGDAVTAPYQKLIDAKKKTAPGTPCPDFTFTDADSTEHRVSELFGRTLMIDVWATWCGPCKAEIPYIEKLVEAYKDDSRLQFVSISIDTDRQAWLNKIAADKPQWPQYHVAGDAYKALLDGFAITGIPHFIIINPDGTIGSPDAFRPSDEAFNTKIAKYLK